MIKLYCPKTKEVAVMDEKQIGFVANIYLQEGDGMLCSFKTPANVIEAIVPDPNYDPRKLYDDIMAASEKDWFEVDAIYVGVDDPHTGQDDDEDEDLEEGSSSGGEATEW